MSLLSRISQLEVKTKSIEDDLNRRKKEEQKSKQLFEGINLIMEQYYPEHEWCNIPLKERHKIFFKPNPRGTYKTEGKTKIFVPSEDKEDLLLIEVFEIIYHFISSKKPT